jgi:hypothetical protein
MELLGKAGNALGTAIQEGFRQAAGAADKMSEQTIQDLEAAQDAWEKLGNQVVIVSGKMIAATISATREITASWRNFFQFAGNVMTVGPGIATAMAAMGDAANQTATQMDKVAASTGPTITEQNKQAAEAKKHASELKQAQEEFARSLAAAINEAQRLFSSLVKLNLINVGLRESVGGVADGTLEEIRTWQQAQKAVDALYDSIRKLEQVKAGDIDVGKLPSGTVDTETISRLKAILQVTGVNEAAASLRSLSQAAMALSRVGSEAASQAFAMAANWLDGVENMMLATEKFKKASVSSMLDVASAAIQLAVAIAPLLKALFTGPGAIGTIAKRAAGAASSAAANTIPHFAEGGYVARPTLAIVGDSPGGEYWLPAQKRDAIMRGLSGTTVVVNIDNRGAYVGSNADQEMARRVVMAIKQNKGGHGSTLRGALQIPS